VARRACTTSSSFASATAVLRSTILALKMGHKTDDISTKMQISQPFCKQMKAALLAHFMQWC
jgi:hypothetical protein